MKKIDVPYAKLSLPYAVASGFYSGCIPVVTRGTAGSIVSAVFGVLLWQITGVLGLILGACVWFLAGWWAVGKIEAACPPEYHDASVFVMDEWCGQWLCLAVALPLFWGAFGWGAAVISLLSFAVFDGLKPFPVCAVDRYVSGGFGVMADDVAAAVGSVGALVLLAWAFL